MSTHDARIDAYIAEAAPFAQEILEHLRELVHKACPDVEETWKWSFPNFMYQGEILCNMAAFKQHCSFGFWKAAIMEDAEGILTIAERAGMGHLGKLKSLKDLPKDAILKKYIKAAMKLTEEGKKLPPKKKPTEEEKKELAIHPTLVAALKKNAAAKKHFAAFSYSKQKEYNEWITEAKTEATRDKRLTTAIEWIAEGKARNWKYENC